MHYPFGLLEISLFILGPTKDAIASKGGLLAYFYGIYIGARFIQLYWGHTYRNLIVGSSHGWGPVLFGHILIKTTHWNVGFFNCIFALPFTLFAMFPQWLSAIPKSGGWMDTVKKILDFWSLHWLSNFFLLQIWFQLGESLRIETILIIWMLILEQWIFCFELSVLQTKGKIARLESQYLV
ncbi:MAG: hypothetical protein IPF63_11600 [Bacteroidetes bacterium]|nr:hypothetical protein [Bacteroidota bacterium]